VEVCHGPETSTEQAAHHAKELLGIEVLAQAPTVADLDGFAAEVEADRI
jgi:hypothetical protein